MIGLILGCPRSGTTAVVRWLDQQDGIAAYSETRLLIAASRFLDEVDRFNKLAADEPGLVETLRDMVLLAYVRRGAAGKFVVDKEVLSPVTFPRGVSSRFLDQLRQLLPGIRFIWMMRHPIPTIWSMRQCQFGGSLRSGQRQAWSLHTCIQTWNRAAELAALQRLDTADTSLCLYEDLITDPRTVSAEALRFLERPPGPAFVPMASEIVACADSERQQILEDTRAMRALHGYGEAWT